MTSTQETINVGAYQWDPNADSITVAFGKVNANFTYLFQNSGDGGTVTLADGSVFAGIGNGLLSTSNTLSVDASKFLSTGGGSLTGALSVQSSLSLSASGSAATVSGGGTLYLTASPGGGGQVWLGSAAGAGAVYSSTIGTTTSNPGTAATNKLWNNGGAMCLSIGTTSLPNPAFSPTHIASQQWGDVSASTTIFSHNHGVVPTPPTPLTATFADIKKLGNVYNFGEIFAPQQTYDAWPTLQNFLLYVQLMRLAQMGASLDNVAERTFTDVYLPAGDFMVSQPLYVPDGVRLGGPGRILRVPYTGNQSNNGTTSVPGIFATSSYAAYLPTVAVVPRAHLSDLNVYVNGGSFAYRGSGVAIGKNWQALLSSSVTIGNLGSGYSVGDIFVATNPSLSPYSPFTVGVTSVNGTGGITGGTITLGGGYSLPPATYNSGPSLQQQQWTLANGIQVTLNHNTTPITGQSVFDPSNPGYFQQYAAYRSDFSTASPGTGATILPTWQQDFQTGAGQYLCGAALTNGTQVGRIQITGSVPDVYDSTGVAGPSYNVLLSGLEMEIDSIQGLGGHTGIWATFCQDTRISRFNTVESNIGFWARGSGSIECPNVVLDTCGCILVIDESHGIRLHGRAFYEEGNIGVAPPAGINTQSVPSTGGTNFAMIIGGTSNPTYPCSCLDIKFTAVNMGGLPASTIAAYGLTGVSPSTQAATCYLAYLFSSTIDLTVSNTSQYGGAVSPLPTSGIYQLGYAVDPGNDLRGSIDTIPTIDSVAPPAEIVTPYSTYALPNCAYKVWDGLHGFWFGEFQALTYASTVNINFVVGKRCTITLTGNVTFGTPTNMTEGGAYAIRIIQDGTGSRTVTWPSAFKWPGGTAGVLSTAANAVDLLTLYSFDGTTAEATLTKAYA